MKLLHIHSNTILEVIKETPTLYYTIVVAVNNPPAYIKIGDKSKVGKNAVGITYTIIN